MSADLRAPAVAGVGGGVGTTTLAVALHCHDAGRVHGGADILACRDTLDSVRRAVAALEHASAGPAPVVAVVLRGWRTPYGPVRAQLELLRASARAVVLLPHVPRWRIAADPLAEAASLLVDAPARRPRALQAYADAVRELVAAVAASGRLHTAAPHPAGQRSAARHAAAHDRGPRPADPRDGDPWERDPWERDPWSLDFRGRDPRGRDPRGGAPRQESSSPRPTSPAARPVEAAVAERGPTAFARRAAPAAVPSVAAAFRPVVVAAYGQRLVPVDRSVAPGPGASGTAAAASVAAASVPGGSVGGPRRRSGVRIITDPPRRGEPGTAQSRPRPTGDAADAERIGQVG